MTVTRKREAVIRLLRRDDLELVSRELGVPAATLSNWREVFLSGGGAALEDRRDDDYQELIKPLEGKVGKITVDNELLREQIALVEEGSPLGRRRPRRYAAAFRPTPPTVSVWAESARSGELLARPSSGSGTVQKGRFPEDVRALWVRVVTKSWWRRSTGY